MDVYDQGQATKRTTGSQRGSSLAMKAAAQVLDMYDQDQTTGKTTSNQKGNNLVEKDV